MPLPAVFSQQKWEKNYLEANKSNTNSDWLTLIVEPIRRLNLQTFEEEDKEYS